MYNIIQHGNAALILFTFPMIGLMLERKLSKKQLYWILAIALILITPIFASYHYIIPYALRILILTLLSAFFAIFINSAGERKYKVRTAWILSTVLFFLLGFFALLGSFAGYQEVNNTWHVGNYKVEYIKDQGFAGGPLMKYELNEYGFIPLFIKKVDVAVEDDSTNSCLIKFKESKITFNKCNSTLTNNAP